MFHALAVLVLLGAGLYLSGVRPSWPWKASPDSGQPVTVSQRYTAPSVPSKALVPEPTPDPVADVDAPLVLRHSIQLVPRTSASASDPEASADTLSLKPENWLHSKEP
jgi:hypothetical protein